MRTSTTWVLVVMVLTGQAARGQSEDAWARWDVSMPTQVCPDGRCRLVPGLPASPVREPWRIEPPRNASGQDMIAGACGYVRLQASTNDGATLWGSAVCVGRGPEETEWVFLTAGHIFAGPATVANVQLDVRGAWRSARVIASNRLPDRAVLLMRTDEALRSPRILQADEAVGPAVMVGFPGGKEAKAFLGRTAETSGTLAWLTLDRASHFDCINGASGGGVYDAGGALIGIQSCTDGRGYVTQIGFTPIGAWDNVFARLGWRPSGWNRKCESLPAAAPIAQAGRTNNDDEACDHANNECDADEMNKEDVDLSGRLRQVVAQLDELREVVKSIPQGPRGQRGERGPQGEPGPAVSEAELARAVAAYLAAHPLERVDIGRLEERLRSIEARMDVPFEVQLFDSGKQVGGSRFVQPHGGYLPLDVFGDVENVSERARGE